MSDLNNFNYTDGVEDVLAVYINNLLASTLRSEYKNVETLAADRTLLDADTPIQRFECGAADRVVKMPIENSVSNHPFWIVNASAVARTITVKNYAGTVTIGTIAKDTASLFLPNANGSYLSVSSGGTKATGAELDTGTDDAKFATAKALKDSHNVPSVAPSTAGNVLTSNGTDWTSAGGSDLPGVIKMYGGAAAPTGYLLCDGASLVRTDYAALFTAIGTTFGSADGTHFNVPDMRGVYPKGAGSTSRAAGKDANGNYYAATLGAYVTDKMQGHRHPPIGSTYFITSTYSTANTVGSGTAGWVNATTGDPVTDGTNGTPRAGLTTEPQNLGLTYIIKT